MSGRLDDEKLETLRSWGAGLAADERDELRAAGKAILILVEEIDRLQVDIWHAGATGPAGLEAEQETEAAAEAPTDGAVTGDLEPEHALDSSLMGRVRRLLGVRPAKAG